MYKVLIPLHIFVPREETTAPLHFVRATYLRKLIAAGLRPTFVSTLMPQEMRESAYQEADGLFITGGHDFHPHLYNAKPHPKTVVGKLELDELELQIIQKAISDKLPCLTICRGCQVLGIATGGSLFQHIPDVYPDEPHAEGPTQEKGYSNIALRPHHEVIIDKDSKAFTVLGRERVNVPSSHHQAINKLGAGFTSSGHSPAGVIEVIEHVDPDYFCFGIQGHPEVLQKSDFEPFYKAFADAIALNNQ